MNKILSFGAGVNSTAILVLHATEQYKIDACIFADTKCEHPETYNYLENTIIPFCEKIQLPFHYVSKGDLREYYAKNNTIPFRVSRSCTDQFKIRPIKKFLKTRYNDYITVLGIDNGEKHRAERYINQSQNAKFEFPLIDLEINRGECKRIIKEFGWKVPIKSGCYFCPFTKKQGWINLYRKHPDLFADAEMFEKNSRKYPEYTLTNKPLEEIRQMWEGVGSMCDWVETEGEPCVFCHS
jgi:hypothetical protein